MSMNGLKCRRAARGREGGPLAVARAQGEPAQQSPIAAAAVMGWSEGGGGVQRSSKARCCGCVDWLVKQGRAAGLEARAAAARPGAAAALID